MDSDDKTDAIAREAPKQEPAGDATNGISKEGVPKKAMPGARIAKKSSVKGRQGQSNQRTKSDKVFTFLQSAEGYVRQTLDYYRKRQWRELSERFLTLALLCLLGYLACAIGAINFRRGSAVTAVPAPLAAPATPFPEATSRFAIELKPDPRSPASVVTQDVRSLGFSEKLSELLNRALQAEVPERRTFFSNGRGGVRVQLCSTATENSGKCRLAVNKHSFSGVTCNELVFSAMELTQLGAKRSYGGGLDTFSLLEFGREVDSCNLVTCYAPLENLTLPQPKRNYWEISPGSIRAGKGVEKGSLGQQRYYSLTFYESQMQVEEGLYLQSLSVRNLDRGAVALAFTTEFAFIVPAGPGEDFVALDYINRTKGAAQKPCLRDKFSRWPGSLLLSAEEHQITFAAEISHVLKGNEWKFVMKLWVDDELVASATKSVSGLRPRCLAKIRNYGCDGIQIRAPRLVFLPAGKLFFAL